MRKETEWEQEGRQKKKRGIQREGGSDGWQALLSADSDVAVGDR